MNTVEEATKLFQDNYNLIFKFLKIKFPDKPIDDDVISCLRIELWKASCNYNNISKFTFSTYVYNCFQNYFKNFWRHIYGCHEKINNTTTSIESYYETIPEYHNNDFNRIHSDYDVNLFCNIAKQRLTPREYEILDEIVRGKSALIISECLGISKQRVHVIISQIRKKLLPYKYLLQ